MGMIVASWVMSTIISIPPLFGLKDPADDSSKDFQTTNHSRGDFFRPRSTSGDVTASLSLLKNHEFGAPEDVGSSDSGYYYYVMSSAGASPIYADEAVNKTLSSDLDEMELNCIISQNLGYSVYTHWKRKDGASQIANYRLSDVGRETAVDGLCSQNLGYTVFSTVGAFYLPLTFIVAIYLNVYRVARSRIHRRQFNRRRDDDRPGAQRDVSTFDPDIDATSQSPGVVWQALRSRLNAISLGLPSSPMASVPVSRTSSVDDRSLRRYGSTSTSAADRQASSTQPQHLLQPPTSRHFLSVDTGPRLSDSSSPPSSASSSRGGSWIYFTRYECLYFLISRPDSSNFSLTDKTDF